MRKQGILSKLLLAMLVAVTLPLATSAVLLLLAVDSSFQVGINRRVQEALEQAPIAYRALFEVMKQDFEHSTDAIAASGELRTALETSSLEGAARYFERLLEERRDLQEIRLEDDSGRMAVRRQSGDRPPQGRSREWVSDRRVSSPQGPWRLSLRWLAPAHHFAAFAAAGQTLEGYRTLQQGRFHLRSRYVAVYLCMVGVALVVALGVGLGVSRRVTLRVSRLCEATRQVAGGNLDTRVPEGPDDEVGELAAAFNVMVTRLQESRERIEYLQRVAAWQQLARRLAHEIKNPLTPIQLAVQELSDRYGGEDESFGRLLQQATEIVVEEVEALRRLTSEFSAFAKLPEVDARRVDLRDFLEEITQSLQLLQSATCPVLVVLPAPGLEACLDRMLMKRVLDNLVRNGVEAIEGSGKPGQVVVRASQGRSGGSLLYVEDNGPGIAQAEKRAVFEPYYTTKEDGTGLGLAIVKKIVLEHAGSVALESQPGRGATFVIRLPG